MRPVIALLLILSPLFLCAAPLPVAVDVKNGMLRGGKPYFVKGGGGETHLDILAARGGNSLRTWSTDRLE